jgi:hypothetical protein
VLVIFIAFLSTLAANSKGIILSWNTNKVRKVGYQDISSAPKQSQ